MKIHVSALLDGELESQEIRETLRGLQRNDELRAWWGDAQVIGAVLRQDEAAGFDVAAQVMETIAREPTVLAPARRQAAAISLGAGWLNPAMALAASVAGITLVVSLVAGLGGQTSVSVNVAKATKTVPTELATASSRRLQEYMVAHQASAAGDGIVGGARHIRTVASATEGRRE